MTHDEPYSYREDPRVPDFDESGPVTFMDGQGGLCTFGAQLIARFDPCHQIKICRVQTPLGHSILGHYELDLDDPS